MDQWFCHFKRKKYIYKKLRPVGMAVEFFLHEEVEVEVEAEAIYISEGL